MVMFDFGAVPPEWNSARLTFGPGTIALSAAAEAYNSVAEALNAAASGSDGSMNSMSHGWVSRSSDAAQAAFRQHAAWLRHEAANAATMSALAASAAAAYEAAVSTMPPLPVIVANLAAQAECVARGAILSAAGGPAAPFALAATSAELAVLEAEYTAMWVTASVTMYAYAGEATGLVSSMPVSLPAPSIIGPAGQPSGGSSAPSPPPNPNGPAPNGPTAPASGLENSPTPDPGSPPANSETAQQFSDVAQPVSQSEGAISDVDQALGGMSDSLSDPGLDDAGQSSLLQHGFYGTSPYSSTLGGLGGGVGSLAVMGMARGGLGAISGATTGFRMPANWTPGTGTPFGAGTGGGGAAPIGNPAPRRGVSAPAARMRQRRDEDSDTPAKVFVPGEQYDVPVLEKPPVIGVIEYDDEYDEATESEAVFEATLVGVLQQFDESEPTAHTAE